MTTEIVLLIKFMRERAQAKFAAGSQLTQSSLVSLLSIRRLKNLTVLKPSQPSPDAAPTLYTTTSALFLYQPPPLWHKNTSTSKNRRQACQSIITSHRTSGGEGAGREDGAKTREGGESRWKDEHRCCRERRINREREREHRLVDQPQTVSLYFDLKAPL